MFRYVPPFGSSDPFFDNFFGYDQPDRQRRPRRAINYDDDVGDRQLTGYRNYPQSVGRWYDDFGHLRDLGDVLKLKEEPDKYLVKVRDANASTKDLQVNYHKKENQLEVTISHNQESSEGNHSYTSSSMATSRVGFDKAVDFEKITADVGSEGVVIIVPKMERDEDNIFKIDIGNSKKQDKIEHPKESET
ncbi:hypothetical protein FT663_00745 [Candidozyma haemuli var. vulneris]|uniref:Uncharacterized protein n=1 Tax=Candidozyma haemuli TaxID=45357 RepID=A0A2V1APY9_9ASCO|nr:hypothetical protein CXQ85_003660 [[Candida] haemuloni]KAF3992465.1 hypothetical protein FT662_01174 [[Candida] haemuloni var. vulneris]KAF3995202.1 hypothetical protein FT663_00745 [[Candida] haemuloni var. vulneris]PVH19802.1 hypothetical protein CXQ85_003660 [[Candida] haemuloni]